MTLKPTKINRITADRIKDNPFLFFIVFLIIFFFGVVVLESTFNNANVIDTVEISNSDTILIGNGTSATLTNVVQSITNVTVKNDTWRDFNLNDDELILLVDDADRNNIRTDDYAISIWVNPTQFTHTTPTIIVKGANVPTNAGYWLRVREGGLKPIELFFSNGTDMVINGNRFDSNLTIGEWTHIFLNFDRNANLTAYLNNQLNLTFNISAQEGIDILSIRDLEIGGFSNSNRDWNGSIDEVRVYNQSFTEQEIKEFFDSGRIQNSSLPSDNLQFWYSLNENQGTTAFDKGLFGQNGTSTVPIHRTDDVDLTLTQNQDFTVSEAVYTLINFDFSWNQEVVNYLSNTQQSSPTTNVLRILGIFIVLGFIAFLLIPIVKLVRTRNE